MPPHHGDPASNLAAIDATDAKDQELNTGVGEGPWVPEPDESTAVTRPVLRV